MIINNKESIARDIKENQDLLVGLFLLGVLFWAVIVVTIGYIVDLDFKGCAVLLAIIGSIAFCYLLNRNMKQTLVTAVVGCIPLFASVFFCTKCYDWSWDGNAYHKLIVGFLNRGWNPLKMTYYDYAAKFPLFVDQSEMVYFDAYPKGTEIIGACFYRITGTIEAGKVFNIIGAIATFCIIRAFLRKFIPLKSWQVNLASGLFVVNPVTLSQLFTYYNDGFLWNLIFVFMVALIYLTVVPQNEFTKYAWLAIFYCINLGFNTKFSALIFFFIVYMGFFVVWLVRYLANRSQDESKKLCLLSMKWVSISGSLGILFTGASSYVVNMLRHSNPVYPMIGANFENITSQLPTQFAEMSNFSRFLTSLFSKTSLWNVEHKIPFMFYGEELSPAKWFDTRIAGWGIFFSGIFLVSIISLIAVGIKLFGKRKNARALAIMLLAINVIMVALVPGLCWARYYVGIFILPIFTVIGLMIIGNSENKNGYSFVAGLITCLLIINILPNMQKTSECFSNYSRICGELEDLKVITSTQAVFVSAGQNYHGELEGLFFNLFDYGIDDNLINTYIEPTEQGITEIFDNTVLRYKAVDNE